MPTQICACTQALVLQSSPSLSSRSSLTVLHPISSSRGYRRSFARVHHSIHSFLSDHILRLTSYRVLRLSKQPLTPKYNTSQESATPDLAYQDARQILLRPGGAGACRPWFGDRAEALQAGAQAQADEDVSSARCLASAAAMGTMGTSRPRASAELALPAPMPAVRVTRRAHRPTTPSTATTPESPRHVAPMEVAVS